MGRLLGKDKFYIIKMKKTSSIDSLEKSVENSAMIKSCVI